MDKMYSPINKKKKRSTARQLQELVEFMSHNTDFARNRLSGHMSIQRNETIWRELANHISNFGPSKTPTQCKVTWRDLKAKVRSRNAQIRRARTATRNSTKVPVLTDIDFKVLAIMRTECSEGLGEQESGLEIQTSAENPSEISREEVEIKLEVLEASAEPKTSLDVENTTQDQKTDLKSEKQLEWNQTSASNKSDRQLDQSDSRSKTTVRRTRRFPYVEIDELAKTFANLQDKNNDVLEGIASTLSAIQCDLATRNQILKERNEIEKERNEIMKRQICKE